MCDFKPGDEVVCIRAAIFYKNGIRAKSELVEGQVYHVARVGIYDAGIVALRGTVAVYLTDAKNFCPTAGRDVGFDPTRFRKIQRRDLQAWLSTAVPAPHLDKRPKKRVPA